MIGHYVILDEIVSIAVAFLLLIVGICRFRNGRIYIGFTVFGAILLVVSGTFTAVAHTNRSMLRNLAPEDVSQIQFGNELVQDKDAIEQVVDALKDVEAFTPNHEEEPAVPFVITLRSGEVYRFRIKYRTVGQTEGIVIGFVPTDAFMSWNQGYAFSAKLPDVLRQLNISLSEQSKR